MIGRLRFNISDATAIEYGLLIALVAIVGAVAMRTVGLTLADTLYTIRNVLQFGSPNVPTH